MDAQAGRPRSRPRSRRRRRSPGAQRTAGRTRASAGPAPRGSPPPVRSARVLSRRGLTSPLRPPTPGAAHSRSQATAPHAAPLLAVVPPPTSTEPAPGDGEPPPRPAPPRPQAAVGRPPEVHRLRRALRRGPLARTYSPVHASRRPATSSSVLPSRHPVLPLLSAGPSALGKTAPAPLPAPSSESRLPGHRQAPQNSRGPSQRLRVAAPRPPPPARKMQFRPPLGVPLAPPAAGRAPLTLSPEQGCAPAARRGSVLGNPGGGRASGRARPGGGAPSAPERTGLGELGRRGVGRARCPVVAAFRVPAAGAPKLPVPGATAYLATRPPKPQGSAGPHPQPARREASAPAPRGTGPAGGAHLRPDAGCGTSGCGRRDSRFLGCRPRLQTRLRGPGPAPPRGTPATHGGPAPLTLARDPDLAPQPHPRPGTPASPRTPAPPRGARSVAGLLARGARVPHPGDQEERPAGLRPGHAPVTPRSRRASARTCALAPPGTFGALGRAGVGGGVCRGAQGARGADTRPQGAGRRPRVLDPVSRPRDRAGPRSCGFTGDGDPGPSALRRVDSSGCGRAERLLAPRSPPPGPPRAAGTSSARI
ncbi:basic proline-rich protein-like [Canis lupus familiaris]|uniref:basic proline-rich protein-like n=1 Tax=Canis lupus familiaris TaxID=9615 RepID=UPI0018F7BE26|nr:basic proline-rich protein-like [Canis lupus familiaris]